MLISCRISPLARSTGVTVLNLLWLEMIDQLRLAQPPPDDGRLPADIAAAEPRYRQIERHLKTVNAKLRASDLILRIENAMRVWTQMQQDEGERGAGREARGGMGKMIDD